MESNSFTILIVCMYRNNFPSVNEKFVKQTLKVAKMVSKDYLFSWRVKIYVGKYCVNMEVGNIDGKCKLNGSAC